MNYRGNRQQDRLVRLSWFQFRDLLSKSEAINNSRLIRSNGIKKKAVSQSVKKAKCSPVGARSAAGWKRWLSLQQVSRQMDADESSSQFDTQWHWNQEYKSVALFASSVF